MLKAVFEAKSILRAEDGIRMRHSLGETRFDIVLVEHSPRVDYRERMGRQIPASDINQTSSPGWQGNAMQSRPFPAGIMLFENRPQLQ